MSHRFLIRENGDGGRTVQVDGVDLSDVVRSVCLIVTPGQAAEVQLTVLAAEVDVDLDALVRACGMDWEDADPVEEARKQLVDELGELDMDELQSDALSRLGGLGDGETSTAEAVVAAIRDRLTSETSTAEAVVAAIRDRLT